MKLTQDSDDFSLKAAAYLGIDTDALMEELAELEFFPKPKRVEVAKQVDRVLTIVAGRIGDKTPDAYRRQRLIADLDGMAAVGGYVPGYFCDTRIAEQLVDEAIAERITISEPDEKPKRYGYRKIRTPF